VRGEGGMIGGWLGWVKRGMAGRPRMLMVKEW